MSFAAEIFARSTDGIELYNVTQQDKYEVTSKVVSSKKCLCMALSSDGKLLAYATSNEVIVIDCTTLKEICSVPKVRITQIAFSPQNNYLTFGHVASSLDHDPNFFVLELSSKSTILELIHKETLEPDFAKRSFQWTSNEKHLIRILHGKLIDYSIEISHVNEWPVNVAKMASFSLSPFANDILIAAHFIGLQNAASSVKLLSLKQSPETRQITSKSFFQGDSMDYSWNGTGDMLLVVNNSETDKTRESYYGRKLLYFFNRKGDACQITVTKEGPIYYADWFPNSNKFIVICGKMPSEVHLFNHKAEFVKVLSTGVFNRAHFNCFENLALFCGFGNLPGNVRALDLDTERQLFDYKASFTTFLQIFFDGVHVLTATTYPHFKIDNGFKIWHYSGHLCYESPAKDKDYFLHQIVFRPKNGFTKPKLSTKVEVIGSITPTRPEPSQKAYVPPHLRTVSDGATVPLPAKPPGRRQLKKKKQEANNATNKTTDESTAKSDTDVTTTDATSTTKNFSFRSKKDNNKKQKNKNNAKKSANDK